MGWFGRVWQGLVCLGGRLEVLISVAKTSENVADLGDLIMCLERCPNFALVGAALALCRALYPVRPFSRRAVCREISDLRSLVGGRSIKK